MEKLILVSPEGLTLQLQLFSCLYRFGRFIFSACMVKWMRFGLSFWL